MEQGNCVRGNKVNVYTNSIVTGMYGLDKLVILLGALGSIAVPLVLIAAVIFFIAWIARQIRKRHERIL